MDLNDADSLLREMLRVDCLETRRGAGAFPLDFILFVRGKFKGRTAATPGSGGSGLFLLTFSVRKVVLRTALGFLRYDGASGIESKTPAAVGDMTEKATLPRVRSSGFTAGSEDKLETDERVL